jgi:antitoxin YefM
VIPRINAPLGPDPLAFAIDKVYTITYTLCGGDYYDKKRYIMEDVGSKMDRFIVTKRGKPVALILSIEDYESILETLDILSNSKLSKRLKRAESDMRKGNVRTLNEIEEEMGIV